MNRCKTPLWMASILGLVVSPVSAGADLLRDAEGLDAGCFLEASCAHPHRHPVVHTHSARKRAEGATWVRTGISSPSDDNLGTGFSLGLEFTGGMNDNLEFGFAVDYVRRGLRHDEVTSHFEDQVGNSGTRYKVGDTFFTNYMPLMLTLRYYFPVLSETPLNPYLAAGGGYGVYWTAGRDAETDDVERAFYGGLAWQVGGGVGFHISQRVSLVGDLVYTRNTVRRTVREGGELYREEWYLSGPAARVGLRFGL